MIVEWKSRAQRDLDQQLDFIALDKPSAADRMAGIVYDSVNMLATWQHLGKASRPGVWEYVIPKTPFVVHYRVGMKAVTIIRLYHAAQSR